MSTPAPSLSLAHLVVEVARPAARERFCADRLGVPPATRTGAWGHRPHLRLRLKMAAGLLRRRLGRDRSFAGAAR